MKKIASLFLYYYILACVFNNWLVMAIVALVKVFSILNFRWLKSAWRQGIFKNTLFLT